MIQGKVKSACPKSYLMISNFVLLAKKFSLLTFSLLFFCNPLIWAQESDSIAYGSNKASTLKYLRSIASEENNKIESDYFIKTYEINTRKCDDATIVDDVRIKKGPSTEATSSYIIIPKGALVKMYKIFPEENYWAIKYKEKWGFVPEKALKKIL